jgi:hypothetical protein
VVSGARGPGHRPWETRCPDHRQPQTEDWTVPLAQWQGEKPRCQSNKLLKSPFDWSAELAIGTKCVQFSRDVQVVLVTEAGLELPLVASPAQIARLLESVSEMAAGVDRDGLLPSHGIADRRPHSVRTHQVLSRVRVVVQRGASTEGVSSRTGLDLSTDGGTVVREIVGPEA